MNPYQDITGRALPDVYNSVEEMIRERRYDVQDYDNLTQRFILGRLVGKIPTGALDTDPSDKIGDFNVAYDGADTYMYYLVDISGTATWARVLMDTGW